MQVPNWIMFAQGIFWLIAVFVLGRWLLLWYFKINQLMAMKKREIELLETILVQLGGQIPPKKEEKRALRVPSIPGAVKALREDLAVHRFPKEKD